MKKVVTRKRNKFIERMYQPRVIIMVVIVVFGVALLLRTKAATTTTASFEAENGTISGNACKNSGVASASSNSFVKYGDNCSTNVTFSTTPGRAIPDTLYGVTLDDVSNLSGINTSLTRHTKRPISRIVFDLQNQASYYSSAVTTLRNTSYIMGEILDSDSLESVSVNGYKTRTQNYVSTFGNKIDIWEIGNELNGEWAGTPTDLNAKVQAAYDVVEKDNASLNLRSAVTLNYWPTSDCRTYSWEDTLTFAAAMPAEVKNGVDYVILSFYETCGYPDVPYTYPTNQQFINVFNSLKTIFPNSKVGMGEIGVQKAEDFDGMPEPTLADKQKVANRYFGMHNALKTALGTRYVGGYFWWYYVDDAVPYNKSQSMWPTIESNFNSY